MPVVKLALSLIITTPTLDWDRERKTLETLLADTMGTKSRTASCYSLIGMAVKYIYDANEQTFLELGHPWEEMVEEFFPGRFRDAVGLTHPEISRPDWLLNNFLRDLMSYASELTISQRKRKLCLAETLKTGTRQAVLGIRISEFRVLNGIALDQIQKVIVGTHQHHHSLCHPLPLHLFFNEIHLL